MSAEIPEYVIDEAGQIREDGARLIRVRADIPRIKAEIERLTANLDGAERLEVELSEALPLRHRALELLCKDLDIPYPEVPPPVEEPPPAGPQEAAARAAHAAAPDTTAAIPMPPLPGDTSGVHPILGKQGQGAPHVA